MVLFDFPHTTVDYLHRVGRTGRVSSVAKCKASILMTHRNDVRIAWKIKVYIIHVCYTCCLALYTQTTMGSHNGLGTKLYT